MYLHALYGKVPAAGDGLHPRKEHSGSLRTAACVGVELPDSTCVALAKSRLPTWHPGNRAGREATEVAWGRRCRAGALLALRVHPAPSSSQLGLSTAETPAPIYTGATALCLQLYLSHS